jgi:hypothetical protein
MKMGKFIDLTDKKFGRLTVIKKDNNKYKRIRWLCKCDCGKEKTVFGEDLKNGHTQSCGCYKKEMQSLPFGESNANKLFNKYKRMANQRKVIFELSKENFFELTKQDCFYCGKIPSSIAKGIRTNGYYIYNGIDRIDSNKGYTIENTVACCGRCNEAKMAETQEDFFEWIKIVHNNLSNKGLI